MKDTYISRHSRASASNTKKPWSRKRKVVTTVISVFIIIFGFVGWFGASVIGSLDKVFHGNIIGDVEALFSQNKLNGETSGRVNILVAGDSADDPGHSGANLTDSIMVLSIDTQNHTGFMLSIPRDLWVYVPGLNSYQKINAANDVTNFSAPGYPSGGMGELQQIVQTDLGIPINYYALVDYSAFKDAVNDVGGITININAPDKYGIYDSYTNTRLPNGDDTLNGQQAIDLARARGDGGTSDNFYGLPYSDFSRTMYQREMVLAILKKSTSVGVLSNPLKISSLFSSLATNVQTNMNLSNVLALASLTKAVNLSKIGSYTYTNTIEGDTNPLLRSHTDPASGQSGLIPSAGIGQYSGLKAFYNQLASNNPLSQENASVEVLNGTNVTSLTTTAEKQLQAKGVISVAAAEAKGNYPTSLIVDNSQGKDPATMQLLEKLFPGSTVTSYTVSAEAKEASAYTDNFVVILGQNYATSIASNPNGGTTSGSASGSTN